MNALFLHAAALATAFSFIASTGLADEAKDGPGEGLKQGQTAPFFVVDFSHGTKKGHPGCPSVMIANADARGVVIIARTVDEDVVELAKSLDAVAGKGMHAYLTSLTGEEADLATVCDKAGLKSFQAGVVRDQSADRLRQSGLAETTSVAVLLLDGKLVREAYFLAAGELSADKRHDIVKAAKALAEKPAEK